MRHVVAALVRMLVVPPALIGMLILPASAARAAEGPVTPTDLDFVRRVHLTAAGAGAASELARGMSVSPAVKRLTQQVTTQCEQLDDLSRSVAGTLEVTLDDPMPAEQQSALATLQQSGGGTFDTGYVAYLWHADSELLPIATTVLGTTRNPVVRRLAERAEAVTAAQLPMLQDSGLLKMTVLPTATATGTAGRLPGGVPMDRQLMAQARAGTGYLAPSAWSRVAVLIVATGVAGILSWHLLIRSRAGRVRRMPARRRWHRKPARPDAGRAAGPRHRRATRPDAGRVASRRR
ncbi:DUF4142 domain-containing protein [Actinoplanes sp. L3-i22]|uniref:DUF4142 domain-containing protein n=1 Tax=Actinoplanes sp. L3-i22 TaxID=2836373 RepID=UPI001C85E134|nr:DUF4142 domain-containing protein [Actinoplanes sp. L3-i22]